MPLPRTGRGGPTVDSLINRLKQLPGAAWVEAHPRLAAWIVLAVGMVILLVIEARDVGLLAGQWIALIVATVLVAGRASGSSVGTTVTRLRRPNPRTTRRARHVYFYCRITPAGAGLAPPPRFVRR